MSREALRTVTLALQNIIHSGLGGGGVPDDTVFVGPPLPTLVGARPVSVLAFHIEPNKELRNADRLVDTGGSDPRVQQALPLDVRYLISVFRQASASDPNELLRMGEVIAALHSNAIIGGSLVPGQKVRLSPEPYPMEELSRIWGLFPSSPYATSMVYLASPVYIDAATFVQGAPVDSRRLDSGVSAVPPDVLGTGGNGLGAGG
ncbi:MAG: DUF4255 domain-containing protein [Paracoccaceae bacterium]